MTLFLDIILNYDVGGFTTDFKKAEYILAMHDLSFDKIIKTAPKENELPTGMFPSGEYIVIFNLDWNITDVSIGLIHYNVDLDKNFDIFADHMSPKSVASFYELKQLISQKEQSELTKIELSDSESDFEIAYENYIENQLNE